MSYGQLLWSGFLLFHAHIEEVVRMSIKGILESLIGKYVTVSMESGSSIIDIISETLKTHQTIVSVNNDVLKVMCDARYGKWEEYYNIQHIRSITIR